MTGFKAPLSLLEKVSSYGFHTFVDAAAFLPTNSMNLSGSVSKGGLANVVDAVRFCPSDSGHFINIADQIYLSDGDKHV